MKGRFWIGVLVLAWGLPGAAQMPEAGGSNTPVITASTGGTPSAGEQPSTKPAQHPLAGALLTLALPPLVVSCCSFC